MAKSTDHSCSYFLCALTILFIAFKLAKIIDWEWYYVLAPLWVPLAIFLSVSVILIIGAAAWDLIIMLTKKKEK